ncbi:hypothetical protein [Kibdelosporangium aridum]|uniref:hypothetical protein n=1 Tax=Kibdelosporangium aridum TaxID=2030 RepID=UPI001F4712C4|nr:hypothetical protein [Kibdelosporangium aridum]
MRGNIDEGRHRENGTARTEQAQCKPDEQPGQRGGHQHWSGHHRDPGRVRVIEGVVDEDHGFVCAGEQ